MQSPGNLGATVTAGATARDSAAAPIAGTPFREGDRLGRYLVLSKLGEGGMGLVLAAYDPELDRKIAIKLVGGDRFDQKARTVLQREARAMARVSHENVIVVHDVGAVDESLFVAMELVDGGTLSSWCEAAPRNWSEVAEMFARAGRGLAAAHDAGLVHRDFKPSNVLVGSDGRLRVSDFGLAAPHRTSSSAGEVAALDETAAVEGTPLYMAPEQHLGEPVDARTDQFAFCAALYRELYRQAPFTGDTYPALRDSVVTGQLRPPPTDSAVPAWVGRLLARGLSRDPADRFPGMAELLSALTVRGPAQRARDIWEVDARTAVRDGFTATGRSYAADTFERVAARVDEYIARWLAARAATFEATHVRGEQSPALLDQRVFWLERRLDELRALLAVFAESPDAALVDSAVEAVAGLTPPERVSHVGRTGARAVAADSARARAVRQQLDRSSALERTGRYEEGVALAEAAHREAAGDDQLSTETSLLVGILRDQCGEFGAAESALHRAAELAARVGDDDAIARAWTHLVWVLGHHQARHDAAATLGRVAEAAAVRADSDDELRGRLWNNLGSLAYSRGRFPEALDYHRRALAVRQAAAGGNPIDIAWSLNNIGTVLSDQGQHDEALSYHDRAIAVREQVLGPRHPDVAISLLNIGYAHGTRKQYADELGHYQRAHSILLEALGPDHFKVGMVVHNIGDVLASLGRHGEALEHQREALRVFEGELDTGHVALAYPLTSTGNCLLALGRGTEAVAPLERARSIREGNDCDAGELGQTLFSLARALECAGRVGDARATAERAAVAYREVADRNPDELAEVEAWLAGQQLP